MLPRFLLAAVVLVISGSGYCTETLMYEDFQDGNSDGWRGFGEGDIRITEYQGNASLQLSAGSAVARQVALSGASRVRVGASFAAAGLGEDSACIAEVTFDDGSSWSEILRVGSGQDDSVTLHSNALSRSTAAADAGIWVRARLINGSGSARCWLDNVYVIGDSAPPSAGAKSNARELSHTFLLGSKDFAQPVPMWEFAQPQDAAPPSHEFSGALKLHDLDSAGSMHVVLDDWNRAAEIGEPIAHLPEFDFEFVQRDHDLVPMQRGVQRREHPYWEIILQPGRVWDETVDDGWTRASVPFSLQERSANCTHNGVLSWLFNAEEISRLVYQISSETCGYLKLDLWGVVFAEYSQQDLSEKSQPHIKRMDLHRASRLPVRELSRLATDYPGTEPLAFGVDDGIHPDDMSVVGMLVNGIHYRSDCYTRQGPYPFCDSMPLPSYSIAKSIFAAVATMRMEQKFPGAAKTPIAEVLEQCDFKEWRDVTVENALDMATGNYRSKKPDIDEDSESSRQFIFSDMHDEKMQFACERYGRKAKPGSQFVYHTSDTYLVGAALQAILNERTDFTDVYRDLLVKPIWDRLNLSPLLDSTKRTYDDEGQPFVGYGLTVETDDIVRIADWLRRSDGVIGDTALLDSTMLRAALQGTASDRGLDTEYTGLKYNNGFWAFDSGPSLRCEGPAWVPFMSGVSGITVAMFPNNVTYYYFSDSYVFRWQSAREAAHAIKDLCR